MMFKRFAIAGLAMLWAASPACAQSTYRGTSSFSGFDVAYELTTFSTVSSLQSLGQGDIQSWSASIAYNGASQSFSDATPGGLLEISGSDLTADSSGLYFNFEGGSIFRFVYAQAPYDDFYYCSVGLCGSGLESVKLDGATDTMLRSGNLQIAATTAPEPGAWAMLIIGFAGIGGVIRRRRARSVAA